MPVNIIPLKCPTCASALSGFEKDVIFFCLNCLAGWDFSEEKPKEVKLSYAKPRVILEKYRMIFYLPFYLFKVSLKLDSRDELNVRASALLKELNQVYVSGYHLMRESYFGDLALLYTEAKIEMDEDFNRSVRAWKRLGSASRPIKETMEYLSYYPLLILDKRQDITGINLKVDADFDRVWAVPFYDIGKQIQDGILGRSIPSFALNTIDEFRKMNE